MSTTLIHLMKLATVNDVVISFRPTRDKNRGRFRLVDAIETDPHKVKKIEHDFDYRALGGTTIADDITMRELIEAMDKIVRDCGRSLLTP